MNDLQKKALALKIDGHTYSSIGEHLGVSAEEAKDLCAAAAAAQMALDTSDLETRRHLELTRLDKLRKVAFSLAMKGDLKAMAEYDKLSKRYDQLVGLIDAPGKKKETPPDSKEVVDEKAQEAIAGVGDETMARILSVVKNAQG